MSHPTRRRSARRRINKKNDENVPNAKKNDVTKDKKTDVTKGYSSARGHVHKIAAEERLASPVTTQLAAVDMQVATQPPDQEHPTAQVVATL